MRKLFLVLLTLALHAQGAPAGAELDRRTNALAEQLRCVVCQNQSIADSQAELAVDLREQVRTQLEQGRSDEQVIDYMVQRYGEFVLYRPPVRGATLLLWAGPTLLLLGGLLALAARLRRARHVQPAPEHEDLSAAHRLLDQPPQGNPP